MAFGSPAYRAGYVCLRGRHGASWQYEGVGFGDFGVEGVDGFFDVFDVLGAESLGFGLCAREWSGGQVCSDVEEFVLYVAELCLYGCGGVCEGEEQAYVAGEFVDCSVCLEAYVVFVYSCASYQ